MSGAVMVVVVVVMEDVAVVKYDIGIVGMEVVKVDIVSSSSSGGWWLGARDGCISRCVSS